MKLPRRYSSPFSLLRTTLKVGSSPSVSSRSLSLSSLSSSPSSYSPTSSHHHRDGSRRIRPFGRRLRSRSRLLTFALSLVLFAAWLAIQNGDVVRLYYQHLRNAPTDFSRAYSLGELVLPVGPVREVSLGSDGGDGGGSSAGQQQTTTFDGQAGGGGGGGGGARYRYVRRLGRGCEGSTELFEDVRGSGELVVVKSWYRRGRNPLPAAIASTFHPYVARWPTEIQATLLWGGFEPNGVTKDVSSRSDGDGDRDGSGSGNGSGVRWLDSGFVPAIDFYLQVPPPQRLFFGRIQPRWQLVTPFIPGGTLDGLAPKVGRSEPGRSTSALDAEFRPALHQLLATLDQLHRHGFCHDDVKSDNIFVVDRHRWLLGDLGNVREVNHPYHRTADWVSRNHLSDCRASDLRRMIKSYLRFLRSATAAASIVSVPHGQFAFDSAFHARNMSWSRLYWDLDRTPLSVQDVLDFSIANPPHNRHDHHYSDDGGLPSARLAVSSRQRQMLAMAVLEKLSFRSQRWQWLKWFWFYVNPMQLFTS